MRNITFGILLSIYSINVYSQGNRGNCDQSNFSWFFEPLSKTIEMISNKVYGPQLSFDGAKYLLRREEESKALYLEVTLPEDTIKQYESQYKGDAPYNLPMKEMKAFCKKLKQEITKKVVRYKKSKSKKYIGKKFKTEGMNREYYNLRSKDMPVTTLVIKNMSRRDHDGREMKGNFKTQLYNLSLDNCESTKAVSYIDYEKVLAKGIMGYEGTAEDIKKMHQEEATLTNKAKKAGIAEGMVVHAVTGGLYISQENIEYTLKSRIKKSKEYLKSQVSWWRMTGMTDDQSKKSRQKKGLIIGRQLIYSFDKLHKKNIVHVDGGPDNVMFKENKKGNISLKLVDFGLGIDLKDLDIYKFQVGNTPGFESPVAGEELTPQKFIFDGFPGQSERPNLNEKQQKSLMRRLLKYNDLFKAGYTFMTALVEMYELKSRDNEKLFSVNHKTIFEDKYVLNLINYRRGNKLKKINKFMDKKVMEDKLKNYEKKLKNKDKNAINKLISEESDEEAKQDMESIKGEMISERSTERRNNYANDYVRGENFILLERLDYDIVIDNFLSRFENKMTAQEKNNYKEILQIFFRPFDLKDEKGYIKELEKVKKMISSIKV